jgi:putative ABC transport system permease protein
MFGLMLNEAWHAMGANRLRTFLTLLGMVIGVSAVVMMVAIGQGTQVTVQQSIASMGSNLFIVLSGSTNSAGVRTGTGNAPSLTVADTQAIGELPTIGAVAPVSSGSAQVMYGNNNWSTQVYGSWPSYLSVREWRIASGAPFTDADVRSARRVALLGKTVADNLFGDEDPVGKTIRIRQSPYLVIGLLAAKGQSLDGRDQDDTVLIPVTAAQKKLFGTPFRGSVRFIIAQAAAPGAMVAAERDMTALLRQRHHLPEEADNDFNIRNLTALAETAAATARLLSLLLGAIASISLLVGGIGIMNIMLVSVIERTREIGIRVAIGARQWDILLQFLLEAIVLSVIGCAIGVLCGVGGAVAINKLTETLVVITLSSILMAFGVAAGVGIFFGFYPANRAARLRPIDALRYQ